MFRYIARLKEIFRARNFDVIYVHLELAPIGPPLLEYLLSKTHRPIVYDIDDLVFLPHASMANRFMKSFRSRSRIDFLLKTSSHVIVCTEHLKKYALQYNDRVTNISSTINTVTYFVNNPYTNQKQVCIGWSGSHSTSLYLHLLDKVLLEIQEKYNIRIKVIGDVGFSIPGVDIDAQEWCLQTEVKDLQELDIGVYPLSDEEWVLGKSGLKALQYMALGIPTVAQSIGANSEIIKDGVNGFLANSEKEWLKKISLLIESPELRKKIGLAGRKTVEEKYSVEVNASRYLEVLHSVYERR
ncbi:MAG: glycosyltransferase family 4 protein [Desulfobacterales bacterium]|nr:glycosyltransferase family 4 protein [Desulfobacterales bacterium]